MCLGLPAKREPFTLRCRPEPLAAAVLPAGQGWGEGPRGLREELGERCVGWCWDWCRNCKWSDLESSSLRNARGGVLWPVRGTYTPPRSTHETCAHCCFSADCCGVQNSPRRMEEGCSSSKHVGTVRIFSLWVSACAGRGSVLFFCIVRSESFPLQGWYTHSKPSGGVGGSGRGRVLARTCQDCSPEVKVTRHFTKWQQGLGVCQCLWQGTGSFTGSGRAF